MLTAYFYVNSYVGYTTSQFSLNKRHLNEHHVDNSAGSTEEKDSKEVESELCRVYKKTPGVPCFALFSYTRFPSAKAHSMHRNATESNLVVSAKPVA
jgi:hypothetical protein